MSRIVLTKDLAEAALQDEYSRLRRGRATVQDVQKAYDRLFKLGLSPEEQIAYDKFIIKEVSHGMD